jgi:hypothetical protein
LACVTTSSGVLEQAVGAEYSAVRVDQAQCLAILERAMSRVLCRLIAALAHLAFRSGRCKDPEIIMLRQLTGPRRQIDQPAFD